jgi:carbapenem resistance CarG-like protein
MAKISLPSSLSVLVVVATALLDNARALELATYKVVDLAYGVNPVDFGPIGTRGTVVLGWRENFNAHGFGVATFYLTDPGQTQGFQTGTMLGLVTVWDDVRNSKEALTVSTSGGADCVLHDFRLLASSHHKPSLLVLADRTMGDTYADENSVRFKVYTLKQNTEQMPGPPTYYFDLTEQFIAKRKYCDVQKAFHDELGIGDYRNRAN